MTLFDQSFASCRCEWGVAGLGALATADVVIVVDVLSFSTCVDVAVSRGVAILPHAWNDSSSAEFAKAQGAVLAQDRGAGAYSLSPASFQGAPAGLRCVLPSPNGAALALRANATGAIVLSGCLRNASAVAVAAQKLGSAFNVCPAGERWPDGSLRPAVEDLLGAGAILRSLPGAKAPEAAAAIAAFEDQRRHLVGALSDSSSGRELIARNYAVDVELAAQYDVSAIVPRFDGMAFVGDPTLTA